MDIPVIVCTSDEQYFVGGEQTRETESKCIKDEILKKYGTLGYTIFDRVSNNYMPELNIPSVTQ